jgi:hypothetical protein
MSTGADWVEQARKLVDTFLAPAGEAAGTAPEGCSDPAAHGADCRWCPVCQVVAVARGERPEVSAALADVLTATAAALRSFAADVAPAGAATPAAEPDDAAAPETPEPVAQRIEIA